ncbi:hypothetical protein [Shewanella frigidimarina]|uniref:hypothetical protein n=1 Tax=Shewanella frigidimarina TaxID=56812 RepID=UPI003D7A5E4D
MSEHEYNIIRSKKLTDIPNLPAHLVIKWLSTQPEFIGEAIAKCCYQQIAGASL